MGGIVVVVAGIWVLVQVTAGDALGRLGLTEPQYSSSTGIPDTGGDPDTFGGGTGGGNGGGGSW